MTVDWGALGMTPEYTAQDRVHLASRSDGSLYDDSNGHLTAWAAGYVNDWIVMATGSKGKWLLDATCHVPTETVAWTVCRDLLALAGHHVPETAP